MYQGQVEWFVGCDFYLKIGSHVGSAAPSQIIYVSTIYKRNLPKTG